MPAVETAAVEIRWQSRARETAATRADEHGGQAVNRRREGFAESDHLGHLESLRGGSGFDGSGGPGSRASRGPLGCDHAPHAITCTSVRKDFPIMRIFMGLKTCRCRFCGWRIGPVFWYCAGVSLRFGSSCMPAVFDVESRWIARFWAAVL